uniref:Taste receptor type 2 n=1 Tax=Astyanax mexicanus TaxID=7994 RepID=A0A3B1ICP8_ASTMX
MHARVHAQLTSQWINIMGLDTFILQLIAIVVLVCTGVMWNSFNLIATIRMQLKTKGIQTMILIIFSFSFSNVILVLSCFAIVLFVTLDPVFMCTKIEAHHLILVYMWLSSSCVSFWSIALLSVLHCVKVVSFSIGCFNALKKNISRITNIALLLICLGSFLLFIPFFTLYIPKVTATNTTIGINGTNVTTNTSNTTTKTCPLPSLSPQISTPLYTLLYMSFLCPIPLMIMMTTSLRMVIHLCQHVLSLSKNQTQVQSLDSYLFICKLNISLVGVYLITLAIVSIFFILKMLELTVSYLLIIFGFSLYCIMTAALLTASTKKLREKFWRMICCKETKKQ